MIKLSFVIPVYNEENRINKCFKALKSFNLPKGIKIKEIIFVNDGSSDKTPLKIKNEKLKIEKKTGAKIKLISYKKNKGKGFAVKKGMLNSTADYTLLFDVDISTPLSELKKFIPYFKIGEKVIIGTRKNGRSTVVVHQPLYRELLGRIYTYLSNFILNIWVTDFTCGFKAFSNQAKNEIFQRSRINRWGYDSEILFIASKLGYSVQEVPVKWSNDKRTKVQLIKSILTSFMELIQIRINQLRGRYRIAPLNHNSILVVSSYPKQNEIHGSKIVGVASYAKNTLISIKSKSKGMKIKVYADIVDKKEKYIDSNIIVERNWKREGLVSILSLFKKVFLSTEKKVMLQFEMFMLGNLWHTTFFVVLLPVLKLRRKQLYIVLHQVVGNIDTFEKNKFKSLLFKLFKPLFYKYMVFSSSQTIVFEEELKERLNNRKVVVVPHAVEEPNEVSKASAKKKLGLKSITKYVLFFGYLSPYKGVDMLVDNWKEDKNVKLILAGGRNSNYKKNKEYNQFINTVLTKAKKKDIITTGFVPENDIKYYFSACDVVLFPYKEFMSSSGPLSLAFAYEKPVLLHKNLSEYFRSNDFKNALNASSLKKSHLLFDWKDFTSKINKILTDPKKYKLLSKYLKNQRSWSGLSEKYTSLLGQIEAKRSTNLIDLYNYNFVLEKNHEQN